MPFDELNLIEINGREYYEAHRGHFDVALVDTESYEEVAHTECDIVVFVGSAPEEDVASWAESYGITEVEDKR